MWPDHFSLVAQSGPTPCDLMLQHAGPPCPSPAPERVGPLEDCRLQWDHSLAGASLDSRAFEGGTSPGPMGAGLGGSPAAHGPHVAVRSAPGSRSQQALFPRAPQSPLGPQQDTATPSAGAQGHLAGVSSSSSSWGKRMGWGGVPGDRTRLWWRKRSHLGPELLCHWSLKRGLPWGVSVVSDLQGRERTGAKGSV